MERDENERTSERVQAVIAVRYTSIDDLVVAYSQDLSKGGLFVKTETFLPVNAVVRLNVTLPDGGGEVSCIGRVVYVLGAHGAKAKGKEPGMGVQFLDVTGAAARRFETFITVRLNAEADASGPIEVGRLRVLVVDDDPKYRELAARAFLARGDEVITATTGIEGLAACLKDRPDVVLSDVQMPKMDGWAFLRMIRARASLAGVPVIFLTRLADERERLRGYRLGVDDYIAKPYEPAELLARVERMVARNQRGQRPESERRSLRGDIQQVSLPSVLSFLELERQTGLLLVVADRTARLSVREGQLMGIEVDGAPSGAPPVELMLELLEWTRGQFEFSRQDVVAGDQVGTSVQALLIEAARISDEKNR